jgi:hypothetical protein
MSLTVQLAEPQTDRRRANRAALRLSATMREAGRSRVQARLIDISTHGCRIECASGASSDTWVWLSIAGLETQYCRVVWRHQEFAGLEFVTPLAEPVLERLLSDQHQLSEASINELRDIASRTHRLAKQHNNPDAVLLADLADKCAVEGVFEGLGLGEADGQSNNSSK